PREALIVREIALRVLIPDFSANAPVVNRHADAAKNDWTRGAAAARERAAEDRVVPEVDELSRLLIPPRKHADAGAEVRDESGSVSDRQPPDRRRERHDAEFQVLFDLGTVVVHDVRVHARHGARVKADAEAG